MASTKECPECGAEVPVAASRCKDCFHDFQAPPKTNLAGPLLLLGTLAAMTLVGAVALYFALQLPVDHRVIVDEESRSITYITQYRDNTVADRLAWSDISRLEYITSSHGTHQIVAITTQGERWTVEESDSRPIRSQAEHYAALMNKPLEYIDNTRGFHKNKP